MNSCIPIQKAQRRRPALVPGPDVTMVSALPHRIMLGFAPHQEERIPESLQVHRLKLAV